MKRWPLASSDEPLAPAVVGDVMAGIGTPRLAACCLSAMQRVLPVTFCTVFAVGASGRIETVSAASSYGRSAEVTAANYVAQRFDRSDPHMVWLAARRLPPRQRRWIGHHRAEDLLEAAYRQVCYDDVGIRERVSVLVLQPTGQRAAVSFYRSLAQPEFDAEDFRTIAVHAALLADAACAHGRVIDGAARTADRPGALPGLLALTPREREVVDRLLAGDTVGQAASALSVSVTTVRTLQYRAFRRLGLRTVNELLRVGASPAA